MKEKKESEEIIKFWNSFSDVSKPAKTPDFRIVDQIASFFSAGSFFYYIFDFSRGKLQYVHPSIKNILGIEPDEFGMEAFIGFVHPDEISLITKKEQCAGKFLFEYLAPEKIKNYKVSYTVRLRNKNGEYYTNLHQSTALNLTDEESIGNVICTETDVSHLNQKSDSTVSFIDLKGNDSYLNLDVENFKIEKTTVDKNILSSQELEIVRKISFGFDTNSIAAALNISPNTVRTHRQNILQKENANNMTELIANYIRHGII